MEKELISVIIPVYNAEKYLEKCINSILVQSFERFELILVDDGSTDSSGTICDSYAERDSRVKAFHKQNEGVSAARDFGVAHSKGEYIAFIDADDYIAEDYLKILYHDINKYHADIACCNSSLLCDEKEIVSYDCVLENRIIKNKAEYVRDYSHKLYCRVVWAKLIRKKLLDRHLREFTLAKIIFTCRICLKKLIQQF